VVDGRVAVVSWWVGCSVMIERLEFRTGKPLVISCRLCSAPGVENMVNLYQQPSVKYLLAATDHTRNITIQPTGYLS
jgi:hypothetical protein